MTTQDRLDYAHDLAEQINQQSTRMPNNQWLRGTDPNEFKKLYTVFCRTQDLKNLKMLLDRLIRSQFCRSKRTNIYYEHIRNVLEQNRVYQLEVADAIEVLGWVGRLLKKQN